MKITEKFKRHKLKGLLLLLALSTMAGCIAYGFQAETVDAQNDMKSVKLTEETTGRDGTDTEKAEKTTLSENNGAGVQSNQQNKVATNAAASEVNTKKTSSVQKSSSGSSSSKKENSKGQSGQTTSVHTHVWKEVSRTKEETKQVPVYGDKCHTCGEDITGTAEKHILDGACTGYDTDVIVSYKTVTEKIPYTSYECSCGAVK